MFRSRKSLNRDVTQLDWCHVAKSLANVPAWAFHNNVDLPPYELCHVSFVIYSVLIYQVFTMWWGPFQNHFYCKGGLRSGGCLCIGNACAPRWPCFQHCWSLNQNTSSFSSSLFGASFRTVWFLRCIWAGNFVTTLLNIISGSAWNIRCTERGWTSKSFQTELLDYTLQMKSSLNSFLRRYAKNSRDINRSTSVSCTRVHFS